MEFFEQHTRYRALSTFDMGHHPWNDLSPVEGKAIAVRDCYAVLHGQLCEEEAHARGLTPGEQKKKEQHGQHVTAAIRSSFF